MSLVEVHRKFGLKRILPLLFMIAVAVVAGFIAHPSFAQENGAYLDVSLQKTYDGTGQGTNSASYVNSANGFAPGDDTPTDGVVSSYDSVGYSLTLGFRAAQARTVTLSVASADYLSPVMGSLCISGTHVKASVSSDGKSCSFKVDEGVAETLNTTLIMTAKDTGGVTKPNQGFSLKVAINGKEVDSYDADPVTVVSTPNTDYRAMSGAAGQDGSGCRASESVPVTCTLSIRTDQLSVPHYSLVKGISVATPYTIDMIVTQFPEGTTWKDNSGSSLDVKTGTIPGFSGEQKYIVVKGPQVVKESEGYSYTNVLPTIPAVAIGNTNQTYDFAIYDEDTNRKVPQPGNGEGRDTSTADKNSGAVDGLIYPNNDWSRADITFEEVNGSLFRKELQLPYTSGKTIFDPEMMRFDKASKTTTTPFSLRGTTLSEGSQFRTLLRFYAKNIKEGASTTPILGDSWDRSGQRIDTTQGPVKVTDSEGNPYDSSSYVVEWSTSEKTDAQISDANDTGWFEGQPDESAQSVRVRFLHSFSAGGGVGFYEVVLPMSTPTNIADMPSTGKSSTDSGVIGLDGNPPQGDPFTQTINIVRPRPHTWTAEQYVTVYDDDGTEVGNDKDGTSPTALAGQTATFAYTPIVHDVEKSSTKLNPVITVNLDKCLSNPVLSPGSAKVWAMTVKTPAVAGPTGRVCGDSASTPAVLEFRFKNGATAATSYSVNSENGNSDARLATITYSGTISLVANGSVTSGGPTTEVVDGTTLSSNSPTDTVFVSNATNPVVTVKSDPKQVETNEDVSWTYKFVYRGAIADQKYAKFVLKLPSGTDASLIANDWGGYTRKATDADGTFSFSSLTQDESNTQYGTTLCYSSTVTDSFEPSDYTSCSATPPASGDMTAIVFTVPIDENGTSAAAGRITLHTSGNKAGNQYNLWPGMGSVWSPSGKLLFEVANRSWSDLVQVKAQTIAGTVWWDDDQGTTINNSEKGISGVPVSLYKASQVSVDSSGKATFSGSAVATMKTGEQPSNASQCLTNTGGSKDPAASGSAKAGYYIFCNVHSGSYVVAMSKSDGSTVLIPQTVKTYYGQDKAVTQTRSYKDRLKDYSKLNTDAFNLNLGKDQLNVDFGFYKPEPKVSVEKKAGDRAWIARRIRLNRAR
ncbi:MAG: hypothetical protein LKI93_00675 [Bifidobacteriaceae bacterium]|jgi:hypothetical protein|nr:hypothetical protein [Bifidobacteriaceae bacterium]MCI1914303.1 hypothetical protein [Bifidobacteriaceae bacterium]